ncbi:MAG: thioredoxin domain-containing protein [Waddliaceae bacterium]
MRINAAVISLLLVLGVFGLYHFAGTKKVLPFSKGAIVNPGGRGAEVVEAKLPSNYCVSFGDPDAPIKITEYFSFFCPYCLRLFREDFEHIKTAYIDTGKVFWTFHPVPMDVLTVQGMHCIEGLSDVKKKALLQVYLSEAELGNPEFCTAILKKAMEVFRKPIPSLDETEYLENTEAFNDAFLFVKKEGIVEAVPSVEVNGKLFEEEVPDRDFIKRIVFLEGV